MQNIAKIKEVLDSLNSITGEYRQCQDSEHSEILGRNMGSAKKQLLDTYTPDVSERFSALDPVLHALLQKHFGSLVLSIGDLQEVHDTKVRAQHIDTDTFHNLLITHIHPILNQIDQRLLAMNVTLQGLSVAAKRNP